MSRNPDWPTEFLGRCQHCLDNAYLDADCDSGRDYECLVKRARIERLDQSTLMGPPSDFD